MKKLPNIITLLFLFIFALQLTSLVFLTVMPKISRADDGGKTNINFTPQVELGKFKKDVAVPVTGNTLGEYILEIYKYAVGAVGIIATGVMMFGGILWIVAGGNAERIGNAKSWIGAALTGLILVMTSYLILYTINPALVEFKTLNITKVEENKGFVYYPAALWKCGYPSECQSIDTNWTFIDNSKCDELKIPKPTDPVCPKPKDYVCCYQYGPKLGGSWSYDDKISQQTGDASASLNLLLGCMRNKLPVQVGRISSISDSNYVNNLGPCNSTTSCPLDKCVHECAGCHYGGGIPNAKSMAVDFGDEENAKWIKTAAEECGAGFIKNEGDHIHVSTEDCLKN